MTKEKIAIIEMVVCSALWSIAGIIIKLIDCNPFVIAGFRSLFAAVTVLLFMLLFKKKVVFNKKVVTTSVFMCLTFLSFVCANKHTTSANAIVLQFTAPVFILIISALFLKQKLRKIDVITTVLTLAGITLFFIDDVDGGRLLGNIFGVLAGLFMGTMFICVGSVSMDERLSGTLFAHFLTALVGIPFLSFTQNTLNGQTVFLFVVLGVVQLGVPYILMCFASGKLRPIAISLLSVIEPLLNPVWVAVFYKEIPGITAFFGAALILITITLWCLINDRQLEETVKGD